MIGRLPSPQSTLAKNSWAWANLDLLFHIYVWKQQNIQMQSKIIQTQEKVENVRFFGNRLSRKTMCVHGVSRCFTVVSRYFHGPFFCFFSFQVASPIKLFSAIDKSSSRKSHHSTLMETLMIFLDSLSRFRLRLMKCKFSHAILVQVAYAVLLFYNELGTRQEKWHTHPWTMDQILIHILFFSLKKIPP